jgi:hypothetical protein
MLTLYYIKLISNKENPFGFDTYTKETGKAMMPKPYPSLNQV